MNLEELFISWQSLNSGISESLNELDFSSIKDIRAQQRDIEDNIYSMVLENAPEDIKQILPEDCGEMEMGYDITNKKFYFLMEDPDQDPDDEKLTILALTINSEKKVEKIKNFKVSDD